MGAGRQPPGGRGGVSLSLGLTPPSVIWLIFTAAMRNRQTGRAGPAGETEAQGDLSGRRCAAAWVELRALLSSGRSWEGQARECGLGAGGLTGHGPLGKGRGETGCRKGSRETLRGLGLILPRDGGRKPGPRAALEGKAEGRVVSTPSSPTRVTRLELGDFPHLLGAPSPLPGHLHLCQSSRPALLVRADWPFESVPLVTCDQGFPWARGFHCHRLTWPSNSLRQRGS